MERFDDYKMWIPVLLAVGAALLHRGILNWRKARVLPAGPVRRRDSIGAIACLIAGVLLVLGGLVSAYYWRDVLV